MDTINKKLQSSLDRLENAIKKRITSLELENTELRAEIIKLKQELKHTKKVDFPTAPQEQERVLSADETKARLKSEIQMSLGQLKKMVV
jgi:regulator of replication initiation timing